MKFDLILAVGGIVAALIWAARCKSWERIENRNYAEMCEWYGEDYLP
jgi:hypothetical protein